MSCVASGTGTVKNPECSPRAALIATVGSGVILLGLLPPVNLHDEVTKATSGLPVA